MTKSVNKHGLTLKGLRQASGTTCHCVGSSYFQIVYDMTEKRVSACYNWTSQEWQEYKNDILVVCTTREHMAMQEIADRVNEALYWYTHA